MSATLDLASTCIGTPTYLAPEMCQDLPYSSKADIWACGCVLYEMCALKPAFDANNLISLVYKIIKENYNPISASYSTELSDIVRNILVKDPEKRPSARQVLAMPYVKTLLSEFIADNESAISFLNRNKPANTQAVSSPSASASNVESSNALGNSLPQNRGRALKNYPNILSPFPLPKGKDVTETRQQVTKETDGRKHDLDEVIEYEDDFEADDDEVPDDLNIKSDEYDANEYLKKYDDDFEEFAEDLMDVVSCAKELQDVRWSSSDDLLVIDDGPNNDIRQILKPHCEAAVGKERFEAMTKGALAAKGKSKGIGFDTVIRSSNCNHSETCYLIEELFARLDVGEK